MTIDISQLQAATIAIKKSTPPFDVLTDKEFELMKNAHEVRQYKQNEIIYNEGDAATGLCMLLSGKVKIFKLGIGGREQIVKLAKANEFIGYRAVIADECHSAAAVALEECRIAFIPKEILRQVLAQNNQLCQYLIKSLAAELRFSRYRSVTLSQKQLRGRLAESLLVLRDKYGYVHGNTLNVNLSREDMANLSNMSTSNAIRTLSNFVSENLIAVQGRQISILNEPLLERISQLG